MSEAKASFALTGSAAFASTLLFKRSVVGSFHQISEKHLDRYLDEFEFRFNNRKNPFLFRDTLTRLVTTTSLPYEKLTA